VINILPGKWPSALQPRFFDVCEKLAQQVANTVEPFLQELIAVNQLWVQKFKKMGIKAKKFYLKFKNYIFNYRSIILH
jgi:hypothetical protein